MTETNTASISEMIHTLLHSEDVELNMIIAETLNLYRYTIRGRDFEPTDVPCLFGIISVLLGARERQPTFQEYAPKPKPARKVANGPELSTVQ